MCAQHIGRPNPIAEEKILDAGIKRLEGKLDEGIKRLEGKLDEAIKRLEVIEQLSQVPSPVAAKGTTAPTKKRLD